MTSLRFVALLLAIYTLPPASSAEQADWLDNPNLVGVVAVSNYVRAVDFSQKRAVSKQSFESDFGLLPANLLHVAAGAAYRLEFLDDTQTSSSALLLQVDTESVSAVQGMLSKLKPKGSRYAVQQEENWIAISEQAKSVDMALACRHALPKQIGRDFLPQNANELLIHWHMAPWRRLQRRVSTGQATDDEREAWKHAERHGLIDLNRISAAVTIGSEGVISGESFVSAPSLRTKSLRMLTTSPASALTIPDWLAGVSSRLLALHADLPTAFQEMDLVFDDLLGEGIDGTYREILADLASEYGLGIDLEEELYPRLGPKLFLVTAEGDPQEEVPDRALLVFETDDVAAVAEVFRRLMEEDEGVSLLQRPERDAVIWRIDSQRGEQPCLATMEGYAVYATDISILENAMMEIDANDATRLATRNRELEELISVCDPKPSLALLDGARSVSPQKVAANAAQYALETFFVRSLASSPEAPERPEDWLHRSTEAIHDPIVLGFEHPQGWRLIGSKMLEMGSD